MLRRASIDDLDAIMVLERSTFTDDAWPEDAMRRELLGEHGFYLVVVDDGDPAAVLGYAGLLAAAGGGQGDIQTIAVDPGRRGHGVGRALMTTLIDEARRRGADEVFLEVRADNPVARGLYASLGFLEIGVRRRYYRGGIDAIHMKLDVPPAVAAPAASSVGGLVPGVPPAAEAGVDVTEGPEG
ncbi:ribosomal protein S18-alanine N-acetyltransferase [Agromyces sp. MMS24-K17]|uniref:ribosomal protein S18-alanine N-acetyltransferase n=1 Tax=Agromyces sp. MMS24-K17 TaxID=3372850 RepID=UPI003754748B